MIFTKKKIRDLLFLSSLSFLISCSDPKHDPVVNDQPVNKETVNPYATHDQSPMDMCYFPKEYPVLRMNGADSTALVARIIYSRPQKKGRNIFGSSERNLVQYGKDWRLGANEATEIEFFKQVTIAGHQIAKGRYIIYCIPYPDKWVIIFNSNLFTWGLHMDPTKDIFKTNLPVMEQIPVLEDFTIVLEPSLSGADMIMAWDNVKTILPIRISK